MRIEYTAKDYGVCTAAIRVLRSVKVNEERWNALEREGERGREREFHILRDIVVRSVILAGDDR